MKTTRLDADFTAAAQIAPDDVATIAALGFRSIMCNRPDAEDPGQPHFAEIAKAAGASGLVTAHVPVVSGAMVPEDIIAFKAAIADLPAPVFAYCRSGTRCHNLWTLAREA